MNPPLYIKYRANGRNCLYDVATGQLFGVSDGIWAVIDDYRRMPLEELIAKHSDLQESVVRNAWQELEENRLKNSILIDHAPSKAAEVGRISLKGECFSLRDFLRQFSSMIILGITERCNLRCEYCCYSGHYGGFRAHANRSMTFEIAQKAIYDHIHSRQKNNTCAVSFYGGEPLLEFDLLKRAVQYAEEEASKVGKELLLNITTNGTLLDDEIMHFLVGHQFFILISLDGPKEAHDRYRVFAGEDHRGSFDTVMKNIRRFVELYPDYKYRGLSMTVAPPILWKETEAVFKEFYRDYPGSRVNLVNPGKMDQTELKRQCPSPDNCKKNDSFCTEARYRFLDKEDRKILSEQYQAFLDALKTTPLEYLTSNMPLHALLFSSPLRSVHERLVTTKPVPWAITVPCVPGYSRRFCDTAGNYHICERVNSSERFVVGNVWSGLDLEKAVDLFKWYNCVTDCANCVARKTCDLCFAAMSTTDENTQTVSSCFNEICIPIRNGTERLLSDYTTIMDYNHKAFDSNKSTDDKKKSTDDKKQDRLFFIPDNDH